MESRLPVSVTIITLNEEANLPDALASVTWASEVVVVDSGSQDRTIEIARTAGARVIQNAWPGFGQQKNFAQSQCTQPWVLNIDADERVPQALAEEIRQALALHPDAQGFKMPRKTYYLGRWIRHGGWYPNRLRRMTRKGAGRWTEPPVHEDLEIEGRVIELKNALDHFAFSSIQDQILTNLRYSRLGSQTLATRGQRPSLVKLLLKPLGKFLETYLIKRGFLDGLPGFLISVNAAHSVFLKYAYLFEGRIAASEKG